MANSSFRWDDDWRKVKLMDWLCTPATERDPATKTALASVFGIEARTMRGWAEHPQFREEWQRRVSQLIGSPERHQRILDELYKAATDVKNRSQVQAAKLYLDATDSIKPPKIEVTVKRPVDLTDDELDALLAQGAVELRAAKDAADD